ASPDDRCTFEDELTHLLVHQKLSFNSPVWFNVGVEPKPQCSACFILSVDDTMDSILDWYRKEGVIFKGGSGSGVNLSRLRSSKERLGGGGTASGPGSFLRAAASWGGGVRVRAGVVHGGGRWIGGSHQVGRQDAPCGQDGRPRRGASRHRRIHP